MPTQVLKTEPRSFARRGAIYLASAFAILIFSTAPAAAESSVTVKADQAKLVAVRGDPAAVVIGNPLYAEVTVRDGMVVIHGRHFGTTNVLVLDDDGNTLTEFELHVIRGGTKNLSVYKGGASFSYQCAPNCESTMQVGDNWDYFDVVSKEVTNKHSLSTGASKAPE